MMITDVLDLFRKGKEAKSAAKQKTMAAFSPVIGGLVAATFKVMGDFGYVPPISTDIVVQIATGVAALWLWVTNFTSTSKIGLLPAKPADSAPEADPRTVKAAAIAATIATRSDDPVVVQSVPGVQQPVQDSGNVGRSLTDIQDPTGFQSGG